MSLLQLVRGNTCRAAMLLLLGILAGAVYGDTDEQAGLDVVVLDVENMT